MAYAVREPDGTVTIDGRPLEPGEQVYRWRYTTPSDPDPQKLTVVRVNTLTVTVRTEQGSEFRMAPNDIAGRWTWSEEE
jgi:hypothetical protein